MTFTDSLCLQREEEVEGRTEDGNSIFLSFFLLEGEGVSIKASKPFYTHHNTCKCDCRMQLAMSQLKVGKRDFLENVYALFSLGQIPRQFRQFKSSLADDARASVLPVCSSRRPAQPFPLKYAHAHTRIYICMHVCMCSDQARWLPTFSTMPAAVFGLGTPLATPHTERCDLRVAPGTFDASSCCRPWRLTCEPPAALSL